MWSLLMTYFPAVQTWEKSLCCKAFTDWINSCWILLQVACKSECIKSGNGQNGFPLMFVFVLDCKSSYCWSELCWGLQKTQKMFCCLCGSFQGKISTLWDTEFNWLWICSMWPSLSFCLSRVGGFYSNFNYIFSSLECCTCRTQCCTPKRKTKCAVSCEITAALRWCWNRIQATLNPNLIRFGATCVPPTVSKKTDFVKLSHSGCCGLKWALLNTAYRSACRFFLPPSSSIWKKKKSLFIYLFILPENKEQKLFLF